MQTSVSQFALWMEFFDWEINAFDKNSFYLAQVAAEVRRPNMPKGRTTKVEDFILKFTSKKRVVVKTTDDVQTRANKAKQFFFGLTGFSRRSNKRK